ncbi:STAS domain-containing protein [Mycolicibacterium sp. BiH015]|uniref:STAS domain-containing protein n=1 Tax=Mycolicibacterium sp. BiH015 TaxID=3018808 RepID=UPI0022E907C4|nr:STAS domain-containing protein [Mycolicibacterium sp. BiH015]MDA2891590.1 STAS domain-containing protein [Mycolicibacterium sp. BiH015]
MSLSEPLPASATQRVFRPDPTSFDLREEHHRATFSASQLSPSTVLVTIHGEIDATNSTALANYIEKRLGASRKLILDLQTVEFFGAAGFAALSNINVVCARRGVRWSLLAGTHVRRLLKVCDPRRELPVAQESAKYSRTRPSNRELLIGGYN